MDRLTRKSQSSEMVWFIDHDNNDLNLEPCEMSYSQSGKAIRKLAYYEDMEEQGKLAILPCKIGDTVYQPSYKFTECTACNYQPKYSRDIECEGCEAECDSICNPYIHVGRVVEMHVLSNGEVVVKIQFTEKWDTSHYTVGKTVFLSKEEAEAALNKKNT